MARYRLSNTADRKIAAIYEYSFLTFGETRADAYFLGMHDLFGLLAANPLMGREEAELGEGVRRFPDEAHLVFYRPLTDGVLILDLFGVRQKPRSFSGKFED
ncbi:MAG: type II toxin-antitoxin system RelE/ParE family toxin [Rhizobiaceae bacterium]|nr:type II toxin-antitoxin system RelE/ParE family toxin [Rhizobiaceae bacterium]